jgi:hypothetical protein
MILALLRGSLGFAVVSLGAFAVWAFGGSWFKHHGGDPAMYAGVAAVFVSLTGLALSPLVQRPRRLVTFYSIFVPAFLAYTAAWCAIYFKLGRGLGEWLASAGGAAAFASIACPLLGNRRAIPKSAVALFIGHSLGYFLGGPIHYAMTGDLGTLGRLLWGLLYGLGFGAGIGYCFHAAQAGTKPRDAAPPSG